MFEVAGAAFAALVFSIVRPEDFDNGVKARMGVAVHRS